MFGFLLAKKRDRASQLLARYQNMHFSRQLQDGPRRESRGEFIGVAWAVPVDEQNGRPEFESAFVVLTKDISPHGLAIVHSGSLSGKQVVIALPDDEQTSFLKFSIQHNTSLGCGFRQFGLLVEEIIDVDHAVEQELRERMTSTATRLAAEVPVAD